jgi:plastocyanin
MRNHRSLLPLAGILAATLAGCGGGQTASSVPMTGNGVSASSLARSSATELTIDGTETVGINLTGQSAVKVKHYGDVLAYFPGSKIAPSAVVTIPSGSSVVFTNLDSGGLPHTAALLGDATKKKANWPKSFTGGTTASKAGTDISTTGFTTGTISAGSTSATYVANVPGFYMFGCLFHYVSHGMRTVIIVK